MIPTGILCGDSVAPVANFTNPAAGNVAGTITLSVNASDNDQIASVQFQIDGANIGAPDTVAPYSISYDTRNVLNGAHTISAVVSDRAGNKTTLNQAVTMVNSPVVTVSIPAQGATVSGIVNITANVTSYDSSVSVQFKIDGGNYGGAQGGAGPHAIGYDTMAVNNAAHSFGATATDNHGNSGTGTNSANVNNQPTNPPNSANMVCSGSTASGLGYFGTSPWGAWFDYGAWVNKGRTLQWRGHMNYTADGKPPMIEADFSHDGSTEYRGDAWDTGLAGGDYDVYSPWFNVGNSGVPAAAQIVGRFRICNEPGGNPQWTDIHESHIEYQWV
jgi:hypothetical protein